MNKVLIVILVWFIVATFFYAAIWTNKNISMSGCWFLTGMVSIGQLVITTMSYYALHCNMTNGK